MYKRINTMFLLLANIAVLLLNLLLEYNFVKTGKMHYKISHFLK